MNIKINTKLGTMDYIIAFNEKCKTYQLVNTTCKLISNRDFYDKLDVIHFLHDEVANGSILGYEVLLETECCG